MLYKTAATLFFTPVVICFFIHIVVSQDDNTCISETKDGSCQADDAALLQQAKDFGAFLHEIFNVNDAYTGTNRTQQELLVLEAVFRHVDMDPSVLTSGTVSSNWYLELFTRITALAPPNSFFTIYKGRPTDQEVQIVAAMDTKAVERAEQSPNRHASLEDRLRQEAFRRYRFRGGTTRHGQIFRMVVFNPLVYWIGYAVPNEDALDKIAKYSPLVEMGAGTGYWSAVLQQRGVDIVAYDSEPPDSDENVYFHNSYTNILSGTCLDVLEKHPEYSKRALLMIWPNNPDNVDQSKEFHNDDLPPVWDVDCLKAYMALGGKTVVFVGEREENIPLVPGAPPESGMTATRAFQTLLKNNFKLVEQIDIPTWWSSDDATIWKRK